MTEVRTRDLAKQLLKGCPGAKAVNGGERDEENAERSEPLSNGDLSEQTIDPGTLHPSPATPEFDPWDIDAAMAASTAQQEADAEHGMENERHEKVTRTIANGNRMAISFDHRLSALPRAGLANQYQMAKKCVAKR